MKQVWLLVQRSQGCGHPGPQGRPARVRVRVRVRNNELRALRCLLANMLARGARRGWTCGGAQCADRGSWPSGPQGLALSLGCHPPSRIR